MKTTILFLFFVSCIFSALDASEDRLFPWNLQWAGSWYNNLRAEEGELPPTEDIFSGGTIYNRGNFTLGLPVQDLSLRFLVTDKRRLPLEENDGRAGFNPGLGFYHRGSGSRFLYGVQNEFGLPARINNVWLRSVPFMETRRPSSRDLKIEPAARDSPEAYLYLGLPHEILPGFDLFVSASLDEKMNPAFVSGFGLERNGAEIRLESFYTQKTLPPRNASTWFSPSPPLPERDFNIYALGIIFYYGIFGFGSDWAYSQTYAWGQDVYGNFALRIGHRPWRFSLAGDGAGSRFADRSGSTAGDGFRLAARGERFWPRSGLLRLQSTIRSPSLEEDFNRGNISLYYRPSAPTAAARRENPNTLRFSRASLSFNRDARRLDKSADSLNALAGFNFGPFSSVFSCSLQGLSNLAETPGALTIISPPFFESFDSFRVAGELRWRPANLGAGSVDLRTRLGYTVRAERDSLWDLSLNASLRPGRWGRIGLGITSTDFPQRWNYTFSWRFEYSGF